MNIILAHFSIVPLKTRTKLRFRGLGGGAGAISKKYLPVGNRLSSFQHSVETRFMHFQDVVISVIYLLHFSRSRSLPSW